MAQARVSKRETSEGRRNRMGRILKILKSTYPDAHCSLGHQSPFQLLVATVLSAQCTDERVNKVTPDLFRRFPDARAMSQAKASELEALIRSTGFFKNKAKSLLELSKTLTERYEGQVPKTLDELVGLRGVGRKTANVVLGVVYGVPGLVVDTHVGRLSRRFGMTRSTDPVKVEHEMMEIVPKKDWVLYAHLLIDHGRAICMARSPDCGHCPVASECPKTGVTLRPAGA